MATAEQDYQRGLRDGIYVAALHLEHEESMDTLADEIRRLAPALAMNEEQPMGEKKGAMLRGGEGLPCEFCGQDMSAEDLRPHRTVFCHKPFCIEQALKSIAPASMYEGALEANRKYMERIKPTHAAAPVMPTARGDVFSRPECIFRYCPHPQSCQEGCANENS